MWFSINSHLTSPAGGTHLQDVQADGSICAADVGVPAVAAVLVQGSSNIPVAPHKAAWCTGWVQHLLERLLQFVLELETSSDRQYVYLQEQKHPGANFSEATEHAGAKACRPQAAHQTLVVNLILGGTKGYCCPAGGRRGGVKHVTGQQLDGRATAWCQGRPKMPVGLLAGCDTDRHMKGSAAQYHGQVSLRAARQY